MDPITTEVTTSPGAAEGILTLISIAISAIGAFVSVFFAGAAFGASRRD